METIPNSNNAKHRNKRTKAQRALDLRWVSQQTLRGRTCQEMSELLAKERGYKVSRQQLSADQAKLKKMWQAESIDTIAMVKLRELKSLDAILVAAWDSWERSVARGEAGNPAFLEKALNVHDRRARIFGLATAERHEISGPQGGPIPILSHPPLSEEAQQEILRRHFDRERRHNEQPNQTTDAAAPA